MSISKRLAFISVPMEYQNQHLIPSITLFSTKTITIGRPITDIGIASIIAKGERSHGQVVPKAAIVDDSSDDAGVPHAGAGSCLWSLFPEALALVWSSHLALLACGAFQCASARQTNFPTPGSLCC